jgi:hypothetical protein
MARSTLCSQPHTNARVPNIPKHIQNVPKDERLQKIHSLLTRGKIDFNTLENAHTKVTLEEDVFKLITSTNPNPKIRSKENEGTLPAPHIARHNVYNTLFP